jgi:hypothetical protein
MAINSSLQVRRPHHGSHIVFILFIIFLFPLQKNKIFFKEKRNGGIIFYNLPFYLS